MTARLLVGLGVVGTVASSGGMLASGVGSVAGPATAGIDIIENYVTHQRRRDDFGGRGRQAGLRRGERDTLEESERLPREQANNSDAE